MIWFASHLLRWFYYSLLMSETGELHLFLYCLEREKFKTVERIEKNFFKFIFQITIKIFMSYQKLSKICVYDITTDKWWFTTPSVSQTSHWAHSLLYSSIEKVIRLLHFCPQRVTYKLFQCNGLFPYMSQIQTTSKPFDSVCQTFFSSDTVRAPSLISSRPAQHYHLKQTPSIFNFHKIKACFTPASS